MTHAQALDRMPQKGAMRLIEEIVSIGPDKIHCIARDHAEADYPLRIGGDLLAVSLVELGAQAAAAHASLHGVGGHHAGLLLALNGVSVPGSGLVETAERLHAHAEQLQFGEAGARYSFEVHAGGEILISGQAMLMMQAVKP
ncbi:hypothetical protein KHP62_03670 [Rhodobacteraceae bacterium NNCM2]|nr:hypothetical protein [Coraliihabitans acroporae]